MVFPPLRITQWQLRSGIKASDTQCSLPSSVAQWHFFFGCCCSLYFIYLFFLLYNTVLVLPHIDMNPPQVYMSSQSWTLLPPPCPYHLSGSSQCISPKHLVSCIEPRRLTLTHGLLIQEPTWLLPLSGSSLIPGENSNPVSSLCFTPNLSSPLADWSLLPSMFLSDRIYLNDKVYFSHKICLEMAEDYKGSGKQLLSRSLSEKLCTFYQLCLESIPGFWDLQYISFGEKNQNKLKL